MEIDSRHCPNCGAAVIGWEVVCPGCDQVPWNTPVGRTIVARRRFKQWLIDRGPILAVMLVLLAGLTLRMVTALQEDRARRTRAPTDEQTTSRTLQSQPLRKPRAPTPNTNGASVGK